MRDALREVTLEEANQKATQLNIMFMETSDKAGHNVKSLFKKIAMSLVGLEKEGEAAEAQNASTCFLLIPLHIITAGSLTTLVLVIPCRNRCHFTAFERRTRGFTVPVLNVARCTHVHASDGSTSTPSATHGGLCGWFTRGHGRVGIARAAHWHQRVREAV